MTIDLSKIIKSMKTEIEKFSTCAEALHFRNQFSSFQDAWTTCPRGDWMLWLAKRLDVDLRVLTKAKALCALTVKHLMKDERSIRACDVALKFGEGEATREELDCAAAAAYAAAYAAYAAGAAACATATDAAAHAAAAYAADAAADTYVDVAYAATHAADAAAYAAAYAADDEADDDVAATHAADAAAAAADAVDSADSFTSRISYYNAKKANQHKTANICREYLTEAVFEKMGLTI